MTDPSLRFVSFEEDGIFYGVCLNRFMMATAPDADLLTETIADMIHAHIEASHHLGVPPFAHLPQAPAEYWERAEAEAEAAS